MALVGFGPDSVVEVSSGLIILWQFRHRLPEIRERQALRLMALSFCALAAYVTFTSVRALLGGHDPDDSPVGIGLAIASLIIMPFLSWSQRRTGRALGSNAVVADATQTLPCPTCPQSSSPGSCSTPLLAGGGRTRSPGSSSQPSRSRRVARRGAVRAAADPSARDTLTRRRG